MKLVASIKGARVTRKNGFLTVSVDTQVLMQGLFERLDDAILNPEKHKEAIARGAAKIRNATKSAE